MTRREWAGWMWGWLIWNFRPFFPVADRYGNNRVFTRQNGRLWAIPAVHSRIVFGLRADSLPDAVQKIVARVFAAPQEPHRLFGLLP